MVGGFLYLFVYIILFIVSIIEIEKLVYNSNPTITRENSRLDYHLMDYVPLEEFGTPYIQIYNEYDLEM